MCSKLRELRIAACDEPLIGILRIRELEEIPFIEEPQLQRAGLDEAADLAALQGGDPRQPVDVLELTDRLVRDHAAIPDENDTLETEGLFELYHLWHQGVSCPPSLPSYTDTEIGQPCRVVISP